MKQIICSRCKRPIFQIRGHWETGDESRSWCFDETGHKPQSREAPLTLEATGKTVMELIEFIATMPEPYDKAWHWRVEYAGCASHEVFLVREDVKDVGGGMASVWEVPDPMPKKFVDEEPKTNILEEIAEEEAFYAGEERSDG